MIVPLVDIRELLSLYVMYTFIYIHFYTIYLFIYQSISPLAWTECGDSLPFSGASSIPPYHTLFPATPLRQPFFHPPSLHPAIYFLVCILVLLFPNSCTILFWEYGPPCLTLKNCVYRLSMKSMTIRDYFHILPYLTGFHNGDEFCVVHGTKWHFKQKFRLRLKG